MYYLYGYIIVLYNVDAAFGLNASGTGIWISVEWHVFDTIVGIHVCIPVPPQFELIKPSGIFEARVSSNNFLAVNQHIALK